jgi:hypothetical protein
MSRRVRRLTRESHDERCTAVNQCKRIGTYTLVEPNDVQIIVDSRKLGPTTF